MATLKPDENNKFINPYNFVSKTSKVTRSGRKFGNLTGSISCRLKVKDALLMPDRNAASKVRDDTFNFYSIDGVPTIPGSEIRGCIRSVYEAITQSCFSVINTETLHQRIPRPDINVVPGILEFDAEGNAKIFKARKCSESDGIWYTLKYNSYCRKYENDSEIEGPDISRNWWSFKKHKVTTSYFKKTSCDSVPCSEEQIKKLLFILDEHLRNVSNEDFQACIKENSKKISDGKPTVVFFKYDSSAEKYDYLSVSQVSRRVFDNTVLSMLGDFAPCTGNDLCPACSLFGTLGGENPWASKLRFTDAVAESNVIIGKKIIVPELSSSKITSAEFYSKCGNETENAEIWNYDDEGVELRGRKFYFHSKPKTAAELNGRNIATYPAEAGSTFDFRVCFNKISEIQLRRLLWVLTIGENNTDSNLMHKIGLGRPVGYGGVKITVDGISLRNFDGSNYTIEAKQFSDYDVSDSMFTEGNAVRQFKKIADYNFVIDKNVSYPVADDGNGNQNSNAAHQWFTSNRTQKGKFQYTLPDLKGNSTSDSLELPAMTANTNTKSYNSKPDFNNKRDNGGNRSAGGKTCRNCGKALTGDRGPLCNKCFNEKNRRNMFNLR